MKKHFSKQNIIQISYFTEKKFFFNNKMKENYDINSF